MEAYQRLEVEWAEFNKLNPAGMVAVSSGTAALHLALEALQKPKITDWGVKPSQVVTSTFNMVAVPRAIVLAGMTPVFVDCDGRLLADTEAVAGAFNPKDTMVWTAVYGRSGWADRSFLLNTYVPRGLDMIEDLAEAHGVTPHVKSTAACWSFYKNKIVAGEEGGAVWFRDPAHAELARCLRSLGFTAKHDMTHVARGHNYRMSNLHAEVIRDSIRKYPINVAKRRALEAKYEHACPGEWLQPLRDAPWVYDIRVPGITSADQDTIVERLQNAGIRARHGFKPMHKQTEFATARVYGGTKAEQASREVIYLPLDPHLSWADVSKSFEVINRCLST